MTIAKTVQQMSLKAIADQCAQQTRKFLARSKSESAYCFELFRRAIVGKNQQAWASIYTQYDDLVAYWVQAHAEFNCTGEECQYFVNRTFSNFAIAFRTQDKFARFASLSAILAYLKACAHSAVRDEARKRTLPTVELPRFIDDKSALDLQQTVLANEQRNELTSLICARVKNAKEQVIIEAYFGLNLKPGEIYRRHSTLFATKQEVYRVKQNLLERLRRDPEMQKMWAEGFPA